MPGAAGGLLTATVRVCGADVPQALLATTAMFPLVLDAVAAMELVVDVPDQPPGRVQAYEVAPGTDGIE